MAGTLDANTPDAPHYVDYEEYVDFQLEKTRSSIKLTDIFTTLTTLAVAVIGYLLVFVVLDQWVLDGGFGYVSRVGLLSVLMIGVLGTLVWRVLLPLLRRVHPLYAARVIERSDPNLKSNLVNFVDVRQSNAQSAPMVLKAMEKRAAVELSHIDVEEAVDRRPLLRIAYALLGIVTVAALYIIFSPKDPFASVKRALLPTAAIDVATETTISDVAPGDKDVPARTELPIEADVRGKDADHAQILFTTADHKYVDQPVEMKRIEPTMPRFRGVLNGENAHGLLQSLTYRIVAGDAHTRDFVVNVIQPPSARVDEVHYDFPTYMQLENTTTQGGHIDGWEGTKVTVKATTNVPVKTATVVLTDVEDTAARGEEFSMEVTDGTKLSLTWPLKFRDDGTAGRYYHIDVKTENKETDPAPTQYTVRIRPDQRPEVALLSPASDLDMPSNGIIPLVIQATDPDFQLRSITLKTERSGETFPDQKLFNENLGQTFRGNYDFRLEPLRLKVGQTIQLWIEAKDNKQPTANRATTPRINVRIGEPASAQAVQQELAKEKQKQQDQLARADDALNPDKEDNIPPRDAGDDTRPEKPQPRPEAGEEPPKNDKKGPERDPENAPNPPDQNNDEKQGQPKKPAPDDFQQALKKLLQKEKPQEQAGEKNQADEQKPQPTEEQNPSEKGAAGKSTTDKSNAGKGNKEGDQSDKGRTNNAKKAGNDSAKSDQAPADDKSPSGDRPEGKNQQPADKSKSKSDKNESPGKNPGKTDGKKDQAAGDESKTDKTGGKGNTEEKNDPSARPEGENPQKSPKSADPKSKPKGDQGKSDSGQSGDDQSGTPMPDKKPGQGDQPAGDEKPGDKNDAGKNDSGKTDDAGKDDAGKKEDAGKKAASGGKDDTGKKDPGKKDGGKKVEGAKPGDQEEGTTDSPKTETPGADDHPENEQKNPKAGGAGQKSADKSDPAAKSNDSSKGQSSPNKTNQPEGDQQEGAGGGEKSKKTGEGAKKASDDSDGTGEEKPADESPDAKKKKATGDESGEATGDKDGDPQAPRAQKDVKKKAGSEAGAKKSSDNPDQGAKKPGEKRMPKEGSTGASEDPDHAQRAPDGKNPTEQPGELNDPPSKPRPDIKKDSQSEKRPDQPPNAGNPPLKGPGRKDGQKAQSPDTGEKGSGAATDQGKPGANSQGPGDKSDEDGNTDPSVEKTGQPGAKKGTGSTTKPADKEGQKEAGAGDDAGDKPSAKGDNGKSGGKDGEPGEADQAAEKSSADKAQGKQAGQKGPPGEGESGEKSDSKSGKGNSGKSDSKSPGNKADGDSSQPGKPGKPGNSRSGAGPSSLPGDGNEPGEGPGGPSDAEAPKPREGSNDDDPPSPQEDEANLEFARKASNLVLRKLKGQLERGEVDQELLDELGWKDRKDVEKLVKFLEQGLNPRDDDSSPEAVARRMQFEETLKSLRLGNETGRRKSGEGKSRAIQNMNTRNVPVPPEYRKLYESYTRSLSKQADPATDKSGAAKAKKAAGK